MVFENCMHTSGVKGTVTLANNFTLHTNHTSHAAPGHRFAIYADLCGDNKGAFRVPEISFDTR